MFRGQGSTKCKSAQEGVKYPTISREVLKSVGQKCRDKHVSQTSETCSLMLIEDLLDDTPACAQAVTRANESDATKKVWSSFRGRCRDGCIRTCSTMQAKKGHSLMLFFEAIIANWITVTVTVFFLNGPTRIRPKL